MHIMSGVHTLDLSKLQCNIYVVYIRAAASQLFFAHALPVQHVSCGVSYQLREALLPGLDWILE